jgi:hypothetical protein
MAPVSFSKLITAVVMKNWREIVESCDLKNWREALAAVLTYAKPDEFSALCGKKQAANKLPVQLEHRRQPRHTHCSGVLVTDKNCKIQAGQWWRRPLIPALGRQRQADF